MKSLSSSPQRWMPSAGVALSLLLACAASSAQQAGGNIFTCINAKGQHLRSDRPIAECTDREQRVLNRDGSLQRVIPPTLTADERAAREAHEREAAAAVAARKEAERSDRNLLQRYPSEASHGKARESALDTARASIRVSEERLKVLAQERKPLLTEAEFYAGRSLPAKLKQGLDANDASTEAQRVLIANQEAEIVRITALYDAEVARLRKLWAGAPPGSLGPVSGTQRAAATPTSSSAKPTAQR